MIRRTAARARAAALALACALPLACKTGDQGTNGGAAGKAASPTAVDPGQQIATVGGQPITYGDVDKEVGTKIRQAEIKFLTDVHDLRQQALDQLINQRVMEAEGKAVNKTGEAWFKQDFWPTLAPTEEEKRQFYEQHKAEVQGRSYEEVASAIDQHLRQRKGRDKLEELRRKHNVAVTMPPPQLPRIQVAAKGPAKGPENAPITIVEFSDFQCPFCAREVPVLERVLKEYPDKVRLVFRQFPLNFHPQAQKAAEASLCAADQGKFWEMHDKMFENQQALQVENLKTYAGELGLDAAKFAQCLDSGEKAPQVAADMKAGEEAGVSGTPAFFINGIFLNGAEPFEKFKDIIDRELQRG